MSKQNATAAKEGKRKKGRPRKRWREEFGDALNITEIKYRLAMARDRRE
jgi:hypothetical protein